MHKKNIIAEGKQLSEATKAAILIHGRGATAEDILSLSSHLTINDFAILAPQATNNTWYPFSFLAPPSQNEPWLSSALVILNDLVSDINAAGISSNNIYIIGFSQGACLSLEFAARNPRRWGGVAAFTGGLIGDKVNTTDYSGEFDQTPIFIGSSDPDPHVPVERVQQTTSILRHMNAEVVEKLYKNMGHTINQDEIDQVNRLLFETGG